MVFLARQRVEGCFLGERANRKFGIKRACDSCDSCDSSSGLLSIDEPHFATRDAFHFAAIWSVNQIAVLLQDLNNRSCYFGRAQCVWSIVADIGYRNEFLCLRPIMQQPVAKHTREADLFRYVQGQVNPFAFSQIIPGKFDPVREML